MNAFDLICEKRFASAGATRSAFAFTQVVERVYDIRNLVELAKEHHEVQLSDGVVFHDAFVAFTTDEWCVLCRLEDEVLNCVVFVRSDSVVEGPVAAFRIRSKEIEYATEMHRDIASLVVLALQVADRSEGVEVDTLEPHQLSMRKRRGPWFGRHIELPYTIAEEVLGGTEG